MTRSGPPARPVVAGGLSVRPAPDECPPQGGVRSEVVAAIAERLAVRADVLAERIAEAYVACLDEYARVPAEVRGEFVRSARANVDALLADLRGRGHAFDPVPFEQFGRDRMRMGIPIGAVMRAFTVWGERAWAAFRACVDPDDREEPVASLVIGERIFAHVERASAATAAGFMREAMLVPGDRDGARDALLEALLDGRADQDEVRRSGLSTARAYGAIVALPTAEGRRVERLVARAAELAERWGGGVRPLVGARDEALVVVVPGSESLPLARSLCADLDVAAGVGAPRAGLAGVPGSYAEAFEAARIAVRLGATEPISHDDVLLERLVAGSPLAGELAATALDALAAYDERRDADLTATLRAYVSSHGGVTETARLVRVHPNTVVYRLRRIAQVCGRDPRDAHDLLVLSVALLARRLGARPS